MSSPFIRRPQATRLVTLLVFALIACVTIARAEDKKDNDGKDKSSKDAKSIVGKWKINSVEADGKSDNDAAGKMIEFDEKTVYHLKDGQRVEPSDYTLDASKDPKEVDFKPKDGESAGKTLKAIYALDGDKLKVCLSLDPEKDRPKEFKSDDGRIVASFERAKE